MTKTKHEETEPKPIQQVQTIYISKTKSITITIADELFGLAQGYHFAKGKQRRFKNVNTVVRRVAAYCSEMIKANPDFEEKAEQLFNDALDKHLNRTFFYTGQYAIEGIETPVFESLYVTKRRSIKRTPGPGDFPHDAPLSDLVNSSEQDEAA